MPRARRHRPAAADRRAVETRSRPARARSRPAMLFSSVLLPAPLAPITATASPAERPSRRRTAPGSRRRTHRGRRTASNGGSGHRPRSPDRFRPPVGLRITACGSPSAMKAPLCRTSRRSMLATKACTTCSIQMIETPLRLTSLMRAISTWHSCSVRPPATSSSSSTRGCGRERARELEPLAVEQGEACRRAGWPCRRGRSGRESPCSDRRRRARGGRPPKAAATTRFSNTLMPPNGCGI